MTDAPNPEADPVSDWEKFAIAEYQAISHAFSSGLNTMAVLLPLFFVFTGAVLNYVAGLFSDIAKPLGPKSLARVIAEAMKITAETKPNMHPIVFFGTDYRIWQIYFISVIALVFTAWSLAFVFVFRNGAGKMLQRASEIENLFPSLPHHDKHKSFVLLNRWYNSGDRIGGLRFLYWATMAFYVLVVAAYVAIIITAHYFNRL